MTKQQRVLPLVLMAHGIIATLTWRDLRGRPEALIRGPKKLWRVASAVNTLGSVAYWTFGRRRSARARSAQLVA